MSDGRHFDGIVGSTVLRWHPEDATPESIKARIDDLEAKVKAWRKETRSCGPGEKRDLLCAKIAGTLTAISLLKERYNEQRP